MYKLSLLLLFCFTVSAVAADWPSFLGPNKNDITTAESNFNADLSKWSKVWENNIGVGYSAMTVSGNMAFNMSHDKKETETLHCFDASSGKSLWKFDYLGPLINKLHKGGPNSTPTVDGDFVFILGKAGQAFCLNKTDGSVVWKKDLHQLMEIKQPAFGFASSPLIYKDWILYTSGKAVALNKNSGELVWLSQNSSTEEAAYHPGHATPVIFEQNGTDYITFLLGTGLEVLKVEDGSFVARHNLKAEYNMTATTPLVLNEGRRIFLSWNRYSEMLDFDGQSLKSAWKKKDYIHTMQNNILIDGVIYGTHGKDRGKRTSFMAIDVQTGKTLWEEKGFRWSQITVVGDTMVCMTVDGNLVTVKVSKEKFEQISSAKWLEGVCWTKPTYANGRLYIRNDLGRVLCLKIK